MKLMHISAVVGLSALLTACASVPQNDTSNPTANFVQVSEGIFRGARPDHDALVRLAGMSVKTILNLEDDTGAIAEERAWTNELGLRQVVASMTGTESPDNQTIVSALSVLADPASRPIFVHCMKGMDRTGAVIALHRVFNEGWGAKEARAEMKRLGFNDMLLSLKEYVDIKIGLD
jgi:protein tyrosine/serine phosphatase